MAYAERLSIADETWKIASQSALEHVQEPFVVAAREVQFPYQLDIQRRLLGQDRHGPEQRLLAVWCTVIA